MPEYEPLISMRKREKERVDKRTNAHSTVEIQISRRVLYE